MLPAGRKPRAVLAVSPRAAERMGRVLDGWEVSQPTSLSELARELGRARCDLVVVGHRFDGSRGLEAVKEALAHAPHVPLACVRAAPFQSALGDASLSAFQAAARALGADGFIDVLQFPDDAEGNGRVRAMLERLAGMAAK